ncbi:MAG: pantoate--beta-alanine ligase [Actinomycetia bacterium]|nr:pantoate--beta-alanine ligase [Actinomycetes bacterium]
MSDTVMELLSTKQELQAALKEARAAGARIGLAPTMGALHAGHGALIAAARRACDFVVVTVFVNPTQFAAGEDLERYPRDLAGDADFVRAAGAQLLFAPSVEELYGTVTEPLSRTSLDVGELGRIWEGALRPTHFAGVALVVTKLLSLVRPDCAFFGEKDYQQLCVLRQLVHDLDVATEIVGVPTVREPDGLAYSSRNRYLDPDARAQAAVIPAALAAPQQAAASGERDARALEDAARRVLEGENAATGRGRFRIEIGYCALVDPDTLRPIAVLERPARLLISVTLAGVHLIDNAEIRPECDNSSDLCLHLPAERADGS